MITADDKLVAREIRQDCYREFSDPYQGASDFDVVTTQELISAYRQRIEARCSLQFGEFIRRREDDIATLREENARLWEEADRRDHALRLYGSQFEEYFQLAHKRPVPSSLAAMLCNMTERHSCEMSKALTQDEIARRMATHAALAAQAPEAKGESGELAAFLSRQIEWSARTFGTAHRTIGILKHIEKEIAEVKAKPQDLTEWIDIIILAIDGYWRHGGSPLTIMGDLVAKAEKNYKRTYPMPASEDEPSEHIRDAAPAPEQGERTLREALELLRKPAAQAPEANHPETPPSPPRFPRLRHG